MAKKVPIEKLGDAIKEILDEYREEVETNSEDAVKKVTKAGVSALKATSRSTFGGKGKYASGWTSKVYPGRITTEAVIYNATTPGLPHLLEFGHAKRGGGRVAGRSHIAPIEQKIAQEFEQQLRAVL